MLLLAARNDPRETCKGARRSSARQAREEDVAVAEPFQGDCLVSVSEFAVGGMHSHFPFVAMYMLD
jgi:hypothetical protein